MKQMSDVSSIELNENLTCLRINEMYREDLISIVQIAATYAILVTAFALWLL